MTGGLKPQMDGALPFGFAPWTEEAPPPGHKDQKGNSIGFGPEFRPPFEGVSTPRFYAFRRADNQGQGGMRKVGEVKLLHAMENQEAKRQTCSSERAQKRQHSGGHSLQSLLPHVPAMQQQQHKIFMRSKNRRKASAAALVRHSDFQG